MNSWGQPQPGNTKNRVREEGSESVMCWNTWVEGKAAFPESEPKQGYPEVYRMITAELQEASLRKAPPGGITAVESKENIPHDCLESLSHPLAGAAQLLLWV